jgi:hypothetical protein
MKLIHLLLFLLAILIFWGLLVPECLSLLLNGNKEGYEEPKRTFGLVLRSAVPEKIKKVMNASPLNAPASAGPVDLPPLPDFFDARIKWAGLITGPLNQASCGSCWAFAIALACSDRLRIVQPENEEFRKKIEYVDVEKQQIVYELNNFSPWQLASCNLCGEMPIGKELEKYGLCQNDSCSGEMLQLGMQYIKKNGMMTVGCDPHQKDCLKDFSNCDYYCTSPETEKCKRYFPEVVHQIDEDLSQEITQSRGDYQRYSIMNTGPLVVGFTVYQSFMDFYKNPANAKKVYTPKVKHAAGSKDTMIGGHAVTLIGWGTDEEGNAYWLIRNSWGRNWADEGYFRLLRGVNFLGIGDDVWSSHWSTDSWHENVYKKMHNYTGLDEDLPDRKKI